MTPKPADPRTSPAAAAFIAMLQAWKPDMFAELQADMRLVDVQLWPGTARQWAERHLLSASIADAAWQAVFWDHENLRSSLEFPDAALPWRGFETQGQYMDRAKAHYREMKDAGLVFSDDLRSLRLEWLFRFQVENKPYGAIARSSNADRVDVKERIRLTAEILGITLRKSKAGRAKGIHTHHTAPSRRVSRSR